MKKEKFKIGDTVKCPKGVYNISYFLRVTSNKDSLGNFIKIREYYFERGFEIMIKGVGIYTEDQIEVIPVEEKIPKKWCIKSDINTFDIIQEYCLKKIGREPTDKFKTSYYHFPTYNCICTADKISPDYTEITFDFFKKHILNKEMKEFKLELKDAQTIINIACKDWVNKLISCWGSDLLTLGYVNITEDFYEEMIKASDSAQKKVLLEIFNGFFEKEIDLLDLKTINNLSLFIPDGDKANALIAIREYGDYAKKSFYLNSNFNWEIKKDSIGVCCLVPSIKDNKE